MTEKRYLGDAVYAIYDGYHIVLTTENGLRATNTIYLDPEIMDALVKYFNDMRTCVHEWVDARNQAVESGEICIHCHAMRAGNETTDTVAEAAPTATVEEVRLGSGHYRIPMATDEDVAEAVVDNDILSLDSLFYAERCFYCMRSVLKAGDVVEVLSRPVHRVCAEGAGQTDLHVYTPDLSDADVDIRTVSRTTDPEDDIPF